LLSNDAHDTYHFCLVQASAMKRTSASQPIADGHFVVRFEDIAIRWKSFYSITFFN